MAERFYNKKTIGGKLDCENFSQLPRKCQEMIFETLNRTGDYRIFHGLDIGSFKCDSPIETMLYIAFGVVDLLYYNCTFRLEKQVEIKHQNGIFKVDFLFDTEVNFEECGSCENELKLVIECDGHEYHHNTKAQVKRDYERDLALKNMGYEVIRFSGSQLYDNPWKCAEKVLDFIAMKVGKTDRGW